MDQTTTERTSDYLHEKDLLGLSETSRAVEPESELEGILGGVGVGENAPTPSRSRKF
jgi:hypothetical protein